VLTFRTPAQPDERSYLADAFPERIAARLARLRPNEVGFRDARQVYRPEASAAATLGKTLHARYVVAGAMAPVEFGGAMTVLLLSVTDGKVVWTGRYDPGGADLRALERRSADLCAKRPLYPGFRGFTTYVT
jgi:TolB-like protein